MFDPLIRIICRGWITIPSTFIIEEFCKSPTLIFCRPGNRCKTLLWDIIKTDCIIACPCKFPLRLPGHPAVFPACLLYFRSIKPGHLCKINPVFVKSEKFPLKFIGKSLKAFVFLYSASNSHSMLLHLTPGFRSLKWIFQPSLVTLRGFE